MKATKARFSVRHKGKHAKKRRGSEIVLQSEFLRFIEYHPPRRFSRGLRKMLMEFMMQDAAVEAFYLRDLLYDLEGLFELLDAASESGFAGSEHDRGPE
jgi:hypothetical protein